MSKFERCNLGELKDALSDLPSKSNFYTDVFFFFKQKTAYEISACLVGSEMCIRDSITPAIH